LRAARSLDDRSKRNSLAENAIPQKVVKSRVFHDVDFAAQGLLEVGYQTTREKGCGAGTGFNQEVEVAVWTGPGCERRSQRLSRSSIRGAGRYRESGRVL